MITEIHIRDDNTGLEFTLECDIETGKLYAWRVVCAKEPISLANALNIPFLLRQVASQSPCAQKAQENSIAQQKTAMGLRPGVYPPSDRSQYVIKRTILNPTTGEPIQSE